MISGVYLRGTQSHGFRLEVGFRSRPWRSVGFDWLNFTVSVSGTANRQKVEQRQSPHTRTSHVHFAYNVDKEHGILLSFTHTVPYEQPPLLGHPPLMRARYSTPTAVASTKLFLCFWCFGYGHVDQQAHSLPLVPPMGRRRRKLFSFATATIPGVCVSSGFRMPC